MGLNDTPNAERIHIGIFGKRNAGKSSLINAITGQDLAVVSDVSGTTTDPVWKSMELKPLGPVVMIDTPGIDDTGSLGALRVKKSYEILRKADIAVLVIDREDGMSPEDRDILARFEESRLPFVIAVNKADGGDHETFPENLTEKERQNAVLVSAKTGYHIRELKEIIAHKVRVPRETMNIVGDLLKPGDIAVLVVPIDSAAPKGRLILPQQMVIRDVLEAGAIATVCRESELKETLQSLSRKPKIVITDSQAFGKVSSVTPADILLTSFSILMARFKGNLAELVRGAAALDTIHDGDRILISEGCTHHRQCDDIGTVKIPRWIREYTHAEPVFAASSGLGFPEDLSPYKLIVHCGGCMLNEREMRYRTRAALAAGVPMTNYGVLIAQVHGILRRSLEPFPDMAALLPEKEV